MKISKLGDTATLCRSTNILNPSFMHCLQLKRPGMPFHTCLNCVNPRTTRFVKNLKHEMFGELSHIKIEDFLQDREVLPHIVMFFSCIFTVSKLYQIQFLVSSSSTPSTKLEFCQKFTENVWCISNLSWFTSAIYTQTLYKWQKPKIM